MAKNNTQGPTFGERFVGRAVLGSITLFMGLSVVATATTGLWLITPLGTAQWFISLHNTVVAAAMTAFALLFFTLFVLHRLLVRPREFMYVPLDDAKVHVGLTAYNDEECIGDAVRDFKACPVVDKVIVVENNSADRTRQVAMEAGADEVVTETVPGYGSCCMRTLAEAARDSDVIILCEGDLTFSANDVKKFLAYLENCDLVLGTRATQELRATKTQMDWLINPGNQIVAKLVQARFWGTRLTDMGCTYRAIRTESYHRLKERLAVTGNHFSPHMFIEALQLKMRVIEIPVVFRQRVGESKGVGSNKIKATKVATAMLRLIYNA